MAFLNGLEAPEGEGLVLELHLDMMEAPREFRAWVEGLGFADDPFAEFYPPEYRLHYTGRMRVAQSEVSGVLPNLRELVTRVLDEARAAGVRLYAESELVRSIAHFSEGEEGRGLTALDGLAFRESGAGAAVKADVHVEFRSGAVPEEVRTLLGERRFYWVRTPRTERFPAEEIATLQTAEFHEASEVYARLVAQPLPGCTGIHLEQKLGMEPSHAGLPMPEVVTVRRVDGESSASR